MSQLVVDEALRARLNDLAEPVTFCDESGRVLGQYYPASNKDGLFVPPPEDGCPYTPEQLDRMRKEKGSSTLKDFWKKMGRT